MATQSRKQTPNLEATLPHSPAAEKSVLGAILMDNNYLDAAADIVKPDDFFFPAHKRIFSTMLEMFNQGKVIDLVVLGTELHNRKVLSEVGGAPYLGSLVDGVPRISNVEHYARIVREKSQLRSLAYLSNGWKDEAITGSTESRELLDTIDTNLNILREAHLQEESAPKLIKNIIADNPGPIERSFSGRGMTLGAPTGFDELDGFTAGWMPEDFVVLGARPSAGKSALLVEFALHQAKAGNPVLIFSLEMTRISLLFRMISNIGHINGHTLRLGNLTSTDKTKMMNAIARISELPIWISDPTRMYSHEVVNKIRFFATRHKIKLGIIDYLQLLQAKAENRVQEVSKVSQDLKVAARILGKMTGGTLLAAAQLSRLDPDEEPQLSNLRESGAIEQDADVVMFLWNSKEEREGGIVKNVTIAKQRNGPIGKFNLLFDGAYTSFVPIKTLWSGSATDGKSRSAGE